jgi:23S rRNA (uracil1939-C5)-methyltransferase
MEYTFSAYRWLRKEEIDTSEDLETRGLGLHIPGRWDKVVDIQKCYLQKDPANDIRNAIRSYAIEQDFSFFNLKSQEGLLRNLIIRTSSTDEVMVILIFSYDDVEKRNALMNYLVDKFPNITSLMYMINSKANDSIYDLEPVLFKGREFIYEKMEDLWFKIGPKSFYQTNSEQAYELYKVVRQYANLNQNEIVYDLYTGTGTIANFLAHNASRVIGIESVPEAIEDAKENASLNQLHNTLFFSGDMKEVLNQAFFSTHGQPDVLITDPPRAGMHQKVVENILKAEPSRIVYVSCNPATQARDIEILKAKYTVKEIQPVDMFPHTYHVENVALLVINQ